MVVSCWVNGCSNRANKHVKRSFYHIPKIRIHEGDQTYKRSAERRRVWLKNIGRTETPTAASRICSDHFVSGKPSVLYDSTNVDWAPTLKLTDTRPRRRKNKQANTAIRDKKADSQHWRIETEAVEAVRALLALS